MEQYIHTLISVDSEFVPNPVQVANFLEALVSQYKFSWFSDAQQVRSDLIVAKPSNRLRWMTNSMTGEKIPIPVWDRLNVQTFEDIPALIEGSDHYAVRQSGQWVGTGWPMVLLKTDRVPYEGNCICTINCELRPGRVSTSAWDVEAGPNRRNIPAFGSECGSGAGKGIFPNPWTKEVIEVDDAGCARFWIEFEFGKFLYPEITNSLEILHPVIVSGAEQCFRTKFAQGCRFW